VWITLIAVTSGSTISVQTMVFIDPSTDMMDTLNFRKIVATVATIGERRGHISTPPSASPPVRRS